LRAPERARIAAAQVRQVAEPEKSAPEKNETLDALTEAIGHLALGIKELRAAGLPVPLELHRAMLAINYALSQELEK
jgi:hypothetical protein